jgi:putative nucleotidyltransferase with HDIG domain
MLPQKVQSVLNSVQSLKPLPSSVTRTLQELENPHSTAGIISEYIGLDQALAALVLQVANSAYLGYDRTCTSLSDAVMRLGFKRLRSVLMASSGSGMLSRSLKGYRQGAGELWQHSLAIAVSAEWLAQALGYNDPEEAYVSGLLHDIGKLMLDQFVLADYAGFVEMNQRYHLPLWQLEERRIGVNHAQVGAWMAEKWQFPFVLVEAIQFHHDIGRARVNPRLAAIINLANHLAGSTASGKSPLFSQELHPYTLRLLRISEDQLQAYAKRIQAKLEPDV